METVNFASNKSKNTLFWVLFSSLSLETLADANGPDKPKGLFLSSFYRPNEFLNIN